MRFSLSALQFGKELLEVKSNAEEKQFGRDIGSPSHQEAPEVPQAGRWLHTPVHVHLLKYFRLLAGSAVDICRPFLYTVHVVSGSLQFQFTTKNEIGNPFWGKSISFFRWGYFATAPCRSLKLPNAKTAPASCYGNRGGLLYFICALYSRFFKLSRNYLRGFLIAGWAGAKIIEYSETSMDVYGLSGSQMPCPFPAGRAADKPLCRTWAVHLPKAECQAAG